MNRSEQILETYMQPVFYFALRKTSSREEAEDFTHNVMLDVLTALGRGFTPDNERAWVWKIARNHYAKWAARQTNVRQTLDADEIRETVSDGSLVEDGLLREEETALLYRELALLSRDYRTIVCEYYFKNRTLADIAESLGLPHGTVKRKISECRKHLKEAINMARTYGKRSFAPELIEFGQNWDPTTGKDGRRYVEHLLAQNILLEAYDNPSTAEDLCLALGIAMPYMEDELNFLMEGELLTCESGKYRTNIVILSKEVQENIYALALEYVDEMAELVKKAVTEVYEKPECPKKLSFDDMKLTLVERVMNVRVKEDVKNLSGPHMIRHKDGSKWALAGFEKTDVSQVWLEVWGWDYTQIIILGNRGNWDEFEFDWSKVPVFAEDSLENLFVTTHSLAVDDLYDDYLARRHALLMADIPTYLHGKTTIMSNVDFRKLVIDRLIETGWITLAPDMNKSEMGVWKYAE
ncbi:MAG: sigma-70 family RNA polymerase sigma factor [Clostridia bacterium]|nr:sigma-70 family RNA polymerase sigma factor [Clostridia bacterium]